MVVNIREGDLHHSFDELQADLNPFICLDMRNFAISKDYSITGKKNDHNGDGCGGSPGSFPN